MHCFPASVLQQLKTPCVLSATGEEYMNEDPYYETIFVLNDFEGDLFDMLRKTDSRILGPPVIRAVAATNEVLCRHGFVVVDGS